MSGKPWPRTFHLQRFLDPSGISGTGVVAWGVQWPDGHVAVRWVGAQASTVVWEHVEDVETIHGHGGSSLVIWHDETDRNSDFTQLVESWRDEAADDLHRLRTRLTELCADPPELPLYVRAVRVTDIRDLLDREACA